MQISKEEAMTLLEAIKSQIDIKELLLGYRPENERLTAHIKKELETLEKLRAECFDIAFMDYFK